MCCTAWPTTGGSSTVWPDHCTPPPSDALAGETYGPVIGAITLLLRACEEDGSVRRGLDPDEILLLLGFLWRIDNSPDWEVHAARLLDIVQDGLWAGAPAAGRPGKWFASWPRAGQSRGN